MPATAIDSLVIDHIDLLTEQIAGFEAGMHDVASVMLDALINIEADHSWQATSLAKQIVWVQKQLRSQLNQAGYTDLAARFVNGYNESQLFSTVILQRLGKMDQMLIRMPENTVSNLQAFDMNVFDEFGAQLVRTMSRELVMSTVGGKTRADIIKTLAKDMEGQTSQATALADTCLRSYDRFVTGQMWEEAGITHYKYFGPSDLANRPFCAAHVNKIYTLAEIKAMSNGSVRYGNVWSYGGGPRCRHTWTPQVDSTTDKQLPAAAPNEKAPGYTDQVPAPSPAPAKPPKGTPAKNIIFVSQIAGT